MGLFPHPAYRDAGLHITYIQRQGDGEAFPRELRRYNTGWVSRVGGRHATGVAELGATVQGRDSRFRLFVLFSLLANKSCQRELWNQICTYVHSRRLPKGTGGTILPKVGEMTETKKKTTRQNRPRPVF